MSLHSDSKILIVGSGVFGLSTALWLARSGYRRVTVFDMQDTGSSGYNPGAGIKSASADINKIIRFSYGGEIEYQRLASQAAEIWEEWNREIASLGAVREEELPGVLRSGQRRVWNKCGFLRMGAGSEFSDMELQTLENMEKEGIRDMQFKSDDNADVERASHSGWAHKLDVCGRQERFGVHKAVLDSSAGFAVAYKACAWAQYLARKEGVEFVLHPTKGKVINIDTTATYKPIVRTADGMAHEGDLVVVAGGGWTAGLLPEADGLIETTAGSVVTIQLPKDRPDLWERFSPENFPVITWGMYEGKDIYSFPRDENGVIKIGFRKTKWTNYGDVAGKRISVPKAVQPEETKIPVPALEGIKEYISLNLPELAELGLASTFLCWYTDSIDNSFVVDFVPGRSRVAVCTGGSGHGFKFLPILGREVVKILEGKGGQTVYGQMWKWRTSAAETRNGLEEGEEGPRVLEKQQMASREDWVF
ncbi:FAD dependent oxidoreductase [Hypoxylon argillaceum]|nr:FAD dependent oxidoreductase [Hypoxylon argillaceum]KAI1154298.1 FAD dependent oxidoreductase [Nemania diffusa]